jgi:hypothetical protein
MIAISRAGRARVVAITMSPTIMISLVAVVVVFAVPMSFVHLPAFAIVIVMWVCPVCPLQGRTLPMPPDPLVTMAHRRPISLYIQTRLVLGGGPASS